MLATGHLWADFLQGSIPALLPFLIAQRGYSYVSRRQRGRGMSMFSLGGNAASRSGRCS